jgi:hypothetical protein
MTLREFQSMMLGAELHIHTNHKKIVNIGDSSQCRLRWISHVDKYGPELHYVEGSAIPMAVAEGYPGVTRSGEETTC